MKKRLLSVLLTLAVVFGAASVASAVNISMDIKYDVTSYVNYGIAYDEYGHELGKSSGDIYIAKTDSFDYGKLGTGNVAPAPRPSNANTDMVIYSGDAYSADVKLLITSKDANGDYHAIFTLYMVSNSIYPAATGELAIISRDILAVNVYTTETVPVTYKKAYAKITNNAASSGGKAIKTPYGGASESWNTQLSFDLVASAENSSFDIAFVTVICSADGTNISGEFGGYIRVNTVVSIDEAAAPATTTTAFEKATFTFTADAGTVTPATFEATAASTTSTVKYTTEVTSVTIAVTSSSDVKSATAGGTAITSTDAGYPVTVAGEAVSVVFNMASGDSTVPVTITLEPDTETPPTPEPEALATITVGTNAAVEISEEDLQETIDDANVATVAKDAGTVTLEDTTDTIAITATGATFEAAYEDVDGTPTAIEDADPTALAVEADKTYYAVYSVDDITEGANKFAVSFGTTYDSGDDDDDDDDSSSSGSSSGCDAGFGALALLAVVPFVKKIRK